jgi:hypothetical protein
MGSRGPKPAQKINWDEFDKLVSFQCTQKEIAAFFDISVDTLERACLTERGEKLADIWDKRKFLGKVRLRKTQFEIAESKGSGAATMAIFLGKVILHQNDRPPEKPPDDQEQIKISPPAKISFEEFCENAGYPKPFQKQCEMRAFGLDESVPRLLLGSRGYGKTDYVTILGVAYDVYLHETETSNLIISKSKTRNSAMLAEIAAALKANGIELEKENSSCIRVKGLVGKDHSVEVLTIKSTFRGRHPKRILMDDPVTEEDISEAMRVLVKRKYDEALKLCKDVCIIGQPAHAFDLYSELRPTLKKLEVPHGQIPELDHDLTAMKLAGVDQNSIEMSYHLRIPTNGSSIFANIKYVDSFPTGDSVAFIDPSDGGDFTALAAVKGYMDGISAQGHCWKKAWYHCLDEIVDALLKLNVKRVFFETNSTGKQPIQQLQKILAPHGIGVVGVHSDTNKHSIIVSAGSYAHMIHLSKGSDRAFIDQVIKYEYKSKHDDCPDSLARCLERLGLLRGKK